MKSAPLTTALTCVAILSLATHASAQLIETETARVLPAGVWEIGAAFEPQTSSDGTEKALPLMVTWGITGKLELMVEPVAYTSIRPKTGPSGVGAGDIEITVTYVFKPEGALPALALAGEAKVPTARNRLIGTGQSDYAMYLTESKRFGRLDTHAHASYTFVGQPPAVQLGNIFGYGVAGILRTWKRVDIFGELLGNSASTPGGEGSGMTPVVQEAAGGEVVVTGGAAFRPRPWMTLYVSESRDNIGALLLRTGFVLGRR